jgi:AcrR family transcriptional regulator
MSSAERKAAIVQAAFEMFSNKGFKGTTTRELAAAVGVSEPVLYQHFATKAELYAAIVDHMLERVSTSFEASMGKMTFDEAPRVFLQVLGEQVMRWFVEETQYIRLLLFSALEGHGLSEIWHERATAELLRMVMEYLGHQAKRGVLRIENPELSARVFTNMVAHHGMVVAIFQRPLQGVTHEEYVRDCVETFLRGVEN